MAAPLNVIPEGLLGFLGIKSGGRNPQVLAEFVQPTFDLWMHYLWSYSQVFQSADLSFTAATAKGVIELGPTAPTNLANAANQVIVPNGQWWAMLEWNFAWTVPGGSTTEFDAELICTEEARGITLGGTNAPTLVGFTRNTDAINKGGSRHWRGIRLVRPGSHIQGFQFGTLGGTVVTPVTAIARWRLTRLTA